MIMANNEYCYGNERTEIVGIFSKNPWLMGIFKKKLLNYCNFQEKPVANRELTVKTVDHKEL